MSWDFISKLDCTVQPWAFYRPTQNEQEVSSEKIIAEAKLALLSLKKDSGIAKGSKRPDDWAALTQEGPNILRIGTEMALVCFG